MIFKFFWIIRAMIYKILFKNIEMPSYIGRPIFLKNFKNIEISKKVRIFPGLRAECHNNGKIYIEENTSIGQNLHIISGGDLKIGKNTTISGNVFITNIEHEYGILEKHILKQPLKVKKTEIGENSFIGYGAVIQAGTILGRQTIVGANAMVKGEYPDYCVIAGNPARIVKIYNKETKVWEKLKK